MDARFRLQNTWLGCNGVVGGLVAVAFGLLLALLGAVLLLWPQTAAARDEA